MDILKPTVEINGHGSERPRAWEKMKSEIDEVMKNHGPTYPVSVDWRVYAEMRFHCIVGDDDKFEIIVCADLLKKGFMAVWNGRPIFVKKGDPEPYPEGIEISKGERR